jgi:hypothetical protein
MFTQSCSWHRLCKTPLAHHLCLLLLFAVNGPILVLVVCLASNGRYCTCISLVNVHNLLFFCHVGSGGGVPSRHRKKGNSCWICMYIATVKFFQQRWMQWLPNNTSWLCGIGIFEHVSFTPQFGFHRWQSFIT